MLGESQPKRRSTCLFRNHHHTFLGQDRHDRSCLGDGFHCIFDCRRVISDREEFGIERTYSGRLDLFKAFSEFRKAPSWSVRCILMILNIAYPRARRLSFSNRTVVTASGTKVRRGDRECSTKDMRTMLLDDFLAFRGVYAEMSNACTLL
jgi:hypothetical protein